MQSILTTQKNVGALHTSPSGKCTIFQMTANVSKIGKHKVCNKRKTISQKTNTQIKVNMKRNDQSNMISNMISRFMFTCRMYTLVLVDEWLNTNL